MARSLYSAGVNDPLAAALLMASGYLLGSLPMGVVVARLTGGTDPRTVGSGRTGGTNALRAMGPARAVAVALLDLGKGAVAILLARWLGADEILQALAGLAAVLGSWKSVFLRFHGGRGVATGVGGMLVVSITVCLIAAPVFFIVIASTRLVSLGSLVTTAFGALVTLGFVLLGWLPAAWLLYAVPGAAIVWLAHADNIARLKAGTERRFDPRDRLPTGAPSAGAGEPPAAAG